MKMLRSLLACFAFFALSAPVAMAQGATPVVLMDAGKILVTSEVGKYADAQVKLLLDQIEKEVMALKPEEDAINAQLKTFRQSYGNLTPQQVESTPAAKSQKDAIEKRAQELQKKVQGLRREQELTRLRTLEDLDKAIRPIALESMRAKGAVMVLKSDAAYERDPNADITQDVITRLNAKVRTIPVTRRKS